MLDVNDVVVYTYAEYAQGKGALAVVKRMFERDDFTGTGLGCDVDWIILPPAGESLRNITTGFNVKCFEKVGHL